MLIFLCHNLRINKLDSIKNNARKKVFKNLVARCSPPIRHKFQFISTRFGIYLVAPLLRNSVIIKVCIKKCDVTDYLVSMILLILSSAFQIGTKPLKKGLCFWHFAPRKLYIWKKGLHEIGFTQNSYILSGFLAFESVFLRKSRDRSKWPEKTQSHS